MFNIARNLFDELAWDLWDLSDRDFRDLPARAGWALSSDVQLLVGRRCCQAELSLERGCLYSSFVLSD